MVKRKRARTDGTLSLRGENSMDPDNSNGINGQEPILKGKNLIAIPVEAGASGKGLPYAPEDWPCAGDNWRWKVGKRASRSGYWTDRFLYLPPRLVREKGRKKLFKSRLLVEQFISREFPDANVKAFFASFIWKIPSSDPTPEKGNSSDIGNGIHKFNVLGEPDTIINQNSVDAIHGIEPSHVNELNDGNAVRPVYITSDYSIASAQLEDEIDQVLKDLRSSQESELRTVHEKLHSHKDYLLSLYQQLESERAELANPTSPGSNPDSLLTSVLNRVDKITQEELKLRDMMQISRGFGCTPNSIHKYYFGSSS